MLKFKVRNSKEIETLVCEIEQLLAEKTLIEIQDQCCTLIAALIIAHSAGNLCCHTGNTETLQNERNTLSEVLTKDKGILEDALEEIRGIDCNLPTPPPDAISAVISAFRELALNAALSLEMLGDLRDPNLSSGMN